MFGIDLPGLNSLKLTSNGSHQPLTRRYRTKIAKTEAYNNSFLQKYLRLFRDGTTSLYKHRNVASYNTDIAPRKRREPIELKQSIKTIAKAKEKLLCQFCGGYYYGGNGLAAHQRLAKKCLAKKCLASKLESDTLHAIPHVSSEILLSKNITQRKVKRKPSALNNNQILI